MDIGSGRGRYPYPWYNQTFGKCDIGVKSAGIFIEAAKKLQNLKENMDAGKIKLSSGDVQAVREVADKADAAQGDRYPEAYMKSLYVDTPLP